jgi:hypothetical protein
MAEGKKTGGGSRKGIPNKATSDVRAAIALIAKANIKKLQGWLDRVAKEDPEKAAKLFLDMIEYHIPKQARTEIATDPENPPDLNWTITVVRPK